MTFIVKDNFIITGRGVVVTGESDGLIVAGDTYALEDGTEFTIRGIERFGTMLGKPPQQGEQIGVLLGNIDRDLVPAGTVLRRQVSKEEHVISAAALAIIDEVLSTELANFTDYLADPMMAGQQGLAVAQAEVDRLQPVLDEVRAAREAHA